MRYALHKDPEALHIDMEGAFSFLDSRDFSHLLSLLKQNREAKEIQFDMRDLKSLDSTAILLLMAAYDLAREAHRKMTFIAHATGPVHDALDTAHAYNAFTLVAA